MNTHPLFRPPAEANSLILRIADGCPWNQCTFCGMYKQVPYRRHSASEIEQTIHSAALSQPQACRIFLADGDVMAHSFEQLKTILEQIKEHFPRVARINCYANGNSILSKSPEELATLRELKLNTLYMGLESGNEALLQTVKKRETTKEMIAAGIRAQTARLKMSVMILTGLGGRTKTQEHATATAQALNQMQPRLLSALRVIPVPGTELYRTEQAGNFVQLTEYEAVKELKTIIQALELKATVFRANHSSNILPLEGRFPHDKPRMIQTLNTLLASDQLNRHTPGPMPLSL